MSTASTLITLPRNFSDKLNTDPGWAGIAHSFISNTTSYLEESPCFFPEYTKHGVAHINKVLEISDKLIPEETMNKLKSRDIAVLIMAILCHDLGMFLKEDGLWSLIHKEEKKDEDCKCEFSHRFGKYWKNEWEKYQITFKHYSEHEKIALFGVSLSIESLSKSKEGITESDKKIYGEFLRIHHSILAYQIATCSFPGTAGYDLFTNDKFNKKPDKTVLREIIGIIANSHGAPMRSFDENIKKKFGSQSIRVGKPLDIPIYYLMSILRIADYLDAGHDRAPYQREMQNALTSSKSQLEYHWNQCINYESYAWHFEHEYLEITAHPKSTTVFIRVEEFLRSTQNELDTSWAILGEQYGVGTDSLLLSIRRIYSNVTNEEGRKSFEESFLTKPAALSADPNILHLLVGPLYGNRPSFGIREMLQNAIDACNERSVYESSRSKEKYKPHISVSIDTKSNTIEITDNGIGMTADTVLQYYLTAGASFRSSSQWYEQFTENDTPKYARNGRFGIGVLAVFLLGNTVEVTTRHASEEKGLHFFLTHDNSNIDVQVIEEAPIGTNITVSSNKETTAKLLQSNWKDWYFLNSPEITYKVNNKKHGYENHRIESWFSVNSTTFTQFRWKYCYSGVRYEKILINGFPVTSESEHVYSGPDSIFKLPSVYIEDKNGDIEMNLARERIQSIPEADKLTREIYKYITARILFHKFTDREKHFFELTLPQIDSFDFAFSRHGYTITNVLNYSSEKKITYFSLLWNNSEQRYYISDIYNIAKNSIRELLIPFQSFASISNLVNHFLDGFSEEEICVFTLGSSTFVKNHFPSPHTTTLINYKNYNILKDVYSEYLGANFFIPYDYEERKKVCAEAFEKLAQYIPEN